MSISVIHISERRESEAWEPVKCLSCKPWGPEFRASGPRRHWMAYLFSWTWGEGMGGAGTHRQIPGDHWPSSLAIWWGQWTSPSHKKWKQSPDADLWLPCAHASMCTHTTKHMCTHLHEKVHASHTQKYNTTYYTHIHTHRVSVREKEREGEKGDLRKALLSLRENCKCHFWMNAWQS